MLPASILIYLDLPDMSNFCLWVDLLGEQAQILHTRKIQVLWNWPKCWLYGIYRQLTNPDRRYLMDLQDGHQNNQSFKQGAHKSTYDRGEFNPSETIYFRPFIGVITPFITSRGH